MTGLLFATIVADNSCGNVDGPDILFAKIDRNYYLNNPGVILVFTTILVLV